ncbi:MAG: 60S ribosomal export protein NMD3 [Halococcoides sp.]
MPRSGRLCPRCGASVESAADPEGRGLCVPCTLDEYDLVSAPDRIEIVLCAHCGAVQRGNRWVDVDADDAVDVAIDAVTEALGVHVDAEEVTWAVAPERIDETTVDVHCEFTGRLRDEPVTETVTVSVRIGHGTCTRCGRIAGGSYGSVLQVRAIDRTPTDEEIERAEAIVQEVVADAAEDDRDAFLTEIGAVEAGLDAKLSTPKLGRQVARRVRAALGGTIGESSTLVTEDEDGNEVMRVTYLVRLPAHGEGAIVDPADGAGPVAIESVGETLRGRRLATGATDRFDADRSFETVGDASEASETTLVTVEDANAIQVIDPESYEPVTIPRPDDLDVGGETVRVVRADGRLYPLPS